VTDPGGPVAPAAAPPSPSAAAPPRESERTVMHGVWGELPDGLPIGEAPESAAGTAEVRFPYDGSLADGGHLPEHEEGPR
jgi:hypothetical protein